VLATGLFALMTTWKTGREILAGRLHDRGVPFGIVTDLQFLVAGA